MTVAPELDRREFTPGPPAQFAAWWSWARRVGYSGRLGSSKTRTVCEAADYDCRVWPGNRVAICRQFGVDLLSSTRDVFMDEVLAEHEHTWWRSHVEGGAMVKYPNGSVLRWFGIDRPGKALSAQYGSIYVDQAEEISEETFKTIDSRVRLKRPPAMFDGELLPLRRRAVYAFNPSHDRHWANTFFRFKEMQESGRGIQPGGWYSHLERTMEERTVMGGDVVPAGEIVYHAIIAGPNDNAENLPLDYRLGLTAFGGPWADRMVKGLWGSFEGQVYPNFAERIHVLNAPLPEWGWDEWGGFAPPTWRRYRTCDFGYGRGHPFVMTWFARVPNDSPRYSGALVGYQEIYRTGRIVSEHAKQAHEYDARELAALNRGIDRWNEDHRDTKPMAKLDHLSFTLETCDHDAEDRATLDACGIVMTPAVKDRMPGAQAVFELLEPAPDPRLCFLRHMVPSAEIDRSLERDGDPVMTWQEFSGLRWATLPNSDDKAPKEDWVKVRDHGTDAARYLVATLKEFGESRVVLLNIP